VPNRKRRTTPADDRDRTLLHELQAPLTHLRVLIEKARAASWCGSECQAALEPCLEQLRLAGQMISDLLLLEKQDAGKLVAERRAVDLGDLVSRTARAYGPVAESKGISLSFGDLRAPTVHGNDQQIRRILANLLDNAVRHTSSGETIRIQLLEGESWAEIQVIDSGCGISPEHLPRIFDRFYQVDKTTDGETGGVGLGLAIARALADQNEAKLSAESTLGKGSKFTLRLPRAARNRTS